ncbi:MAG: hypothetical protein BroJett026_19610 [Betaproteobacteria bacterium]|nr:MAG: hypothetical protein BroJett026_19610 [Betaproteobacteria bacterium]
MDSLSTRLSESRFGPLAGWLAVAAVASALWVLVRHGLAIPASTDDYCNRLNALQGTLAQATLASYTGWTGRLLTTAVLYAVLRVVDLPDLAKVSAVLPALLAACAWMLAGAFGTRHRLDRLAIAALAFVALVLGTHRLLGQTVFWATGGIVYLVPLFLLATWLAMMARVAGGRPPRGGAWSAFALGVLAGNAIELAWSALAIVGLAVLVHVRRQDAPRASALAGLAGALAGGAVLAAAPGNFHRATATERSFSLDLPWLGGEYARMVGEVFAAAPGVPVGAALLVVLGAAVRTPSAATHLRQRALIAALLVAAAFASLLPVLAVPPQFAPRNGLYLLVLLLAAALAFAIPPLVSTRYGTLAIALFALAGSIVVSARFAEDTEIARVLQARWIGRDHALRAAAASGQREVVLPRLTVYPPPTVHAIELGEDPDRWDNRCVARYHGLAAVSVPPAR